MSNTSVGEKIAIGCGAMVIALFVLTPLQLLIDALVLSKLWLWFVAVPFEVQALSMVHCIGLSILLGFAVRHAPDLKRDDKNAGETFVAVAVGLLFTPLWTLTIGWILKSYFLS